MRLRAAFLVLICVGLLSKAEGLGSLTNEGSVWKKTNYQCVIRSLVEDPQGRIYAGTFGAGLWIREHGSWRQIATSAEGLPDLRISRIALEGDDLLVATAGGGAVRMQRSTGRWGPLVKGSVPASRHFHALLETGTGSYLLGAVGEGVFLSRGGEWLQVTTDDRLPSNWVNDAVPASGGVWLGTYDGLAFLQEGRLGVVEMPEGGWTDGNINVLAWFQGDLFLGTASGGLARRIEPPASARGKNRRPSFRRVKGVPKQVHALLEHAGELWIGTETGVFVLSGAGDLREITAPGGRRVAAKSLATARGGVLLGTDVGQIYLLGDKKWECLFDYSTIHRGGPPK